MSFDIRLNATPDFKEKRNAAHAAFLKIWSTFPLNLQMTTKCELRSDITDAETQKQRYRNQYTENLLFRNKIQNVGQEAELLSDILDDASIEVPEDSKRNDRTDQSNHNTFDDEGCSYKGVLRTDQFHDGDLILTNRDTNSNGIRDKEDSNRDQDGDDGNRDEGDQPVEVRQRIRCSL